MAAPRRIGILTGGGDVPGLNSVIKSVVYRATELGYEVIGIRRGWEGLTHQRRTADLDPEYARVLDRINTRTIDRTGGTILHSSRTNPRKMGAASLPSWLDPTSVADKQTAEGVYDLTDHVLDTISHLGLTHLVTIGGDDTLSFSLRAVRAWPAPGRHPQDDGQRRQRDGVLHRLLVRDHARQGGPQSPADDPGQPRADRRVPHLRARRRLHGAVHGVRHVHPLRDPRVPVRPRLPRGDPQGGPPQQPQPLRGDHHRRGRDLEGRPARRRRRHRCVRPPAQGQHRRGAGERAQGPHGHRGRRVRADLRPPLGRAGHAGLDGGDRPSRTSPWT